MYDAIVAGHICLDIFPDLSGSAQDRFEATLQPGRLVIVGAADYCTGGPVSNTGLPLTKLGIRTQLMGKVGDDLFGRAVQDYLRTYGAHLTDAMVVDPATRTSYTIVISPPGVDRIFLHYPGANDTFDANDVRWISIEGTSPSFQELMADLREQRIIYVGETHVSQPDHDIQEKVLAALFGENKDLTLAMEMFPRRYQGVLDKWSAGSIGEEQFIEEA